MGDLRAGRCQESSGGVSGRGHLEAAPETGGASKTSRTAGRWARSRLLATGLSAVGALSACFSMPLGGEEPVLVPTPTPGWALDQDGDGFAAAEDCQDDNPEIHPLAQERCGDGVDQNCNGFADEQCDCGPQDLITSLQPLAAQDDLEQVTVACSAPVSFKATILNGCNNIVELASSSSCFVRVDIVRLESDDEEMMVGVYPESCDAPDAEWALGSGESLSLVWEWPEDVSASEPGEYEFRAAWPNGHGARLAVTLLSPCEPEGEPETEDTHTPEPGEEGHGT